MAEGPETQASSSTSSEADSLNKQTQVPAFCSLQSPNGDIPMFPFMYPAFVPQLLTQQDQEQMNRGPGLYAVHALPFQPIVGFPSHTLIPFTYNIPVEHSSPETQAVGDEQRQVGEQQQQQQPGPERQVIVRRLRFQIEFHLDLFLILKLAAVIFLFNDGSRQRLALLVVFASLVYLYQTGALAPLVRWLSQGMRRAAVPPQPPRGGAIRAENVPAAAREGNENAAAAGGQPGDQNEHPRVDDGNGAVENEHAAEPGGVEVGNRWWGIVKEIQMIVFGFITSLLPGFHNID